MAKFKVELTPPVPEASKITSEFRDFNPRWLEINEKIPEQYQIVYHVNDDIFAYYPTDIVTSFSDLTEEIAQFKAQRSHYVSLSGYNVAYARCENNRVWFYDPPEVFGSEDQVAIEGEGVPLGLIIELLERAASALQAQIISTLELSS